MVLIYFIRSLHCGCSADQILLFVTDIALDKGYTVCAAFLDLRKAFDSLDHSILLDCFHKLGTELLWFRHYLADRQQRVKFGDSYPDWETVLGSIPEGSALGPLLFLIYVNDNAPTSKEWSFSSVA